jgi:serine/threonine protein kinase
VRVECSNCQRSFELDDARIKADALTALRCVCAERIDFGPQSAGQKPRLGKYILINRIAVGGMGEIYYGKVSGVEGFEKEVAIKRMLPHLSADRNFVAMMVKEAKLTVLLNHPNIVGVHDLARQGDEYYIAMEYVPGVTVGYILEETRKRGTMLPPEVAVHIVMQVLRGLNYAHNLPMPNGEHLSILHRDITPQNILVTQQGYVKITDFGIAKAANEISTTTVGMIKGKMGYIAPEQLEGREPDHRIDLFCAGILLWEMLMARRLFKGNSEIDTFRLISECNVPPLATVRSDVAVAIESVLSRSLARNPDDRYAQADEFNAALAQAILPRTADDLARATASYFAANAHYFSPIVAHKGDPAQDAPKSRSLQNLVAPPVETAKLPPVGDYIFVQGAVAPPPPVKSASKGNYALVALAACAVVAVCMLFYQRVVAPPRAASVETLASSTPAPPAAPTLPVAAPSIPGAAPTSPGATPPGAEAKPPTTAAEAPEAPSDTAAGPKEAAPPATNPNAPPGEAAPQSAPATEPPSGGLRPPKPEYERRPARTPSRREPMAKPLTGAQIQSTVQRYQSGIAQCLSDINMSTAPSKVDAQITIDVTGAVSMVRITPAVGQPPVDRCLAKALKAMRFHRHPPPDLKVTIPLKIQVL